MNKAYLVERKEGGNTSGPEKLSLVDAILIIMKRNYQKIRDDRSPI